MIVTMVIKIQIVYSRNRFSSYTMNLSLNSNLIKCIIVIYSTTSSARYLMYCRTQYPLGKWHLAAYLFIHNYSLFLKMFEMSSFLIKLQVVQFLYIGFKYIFQSFCFNLECFVKFCKHFQGPIDRQVYYEKLHYNVV